MSSRLLRILLIALLSLMVSLLFIGCGQSKKDNKDPQAGQTQNDGSNQDGSEKEKITIRLAHHMVPASLEGISIEKFVKIVEEKTNGIVEFKLFPGGQLGGERDVHENVVNGTLEMTLASTALLGSLDSNFKVIDLPYIWRDYDHAKKALEGEAGQALEDSLLNSQGLKTIMWLPAGFRHVWAKDRQIRTVNDFKGLKIRSPEAEVYVATFKALGANPTPVPWPEVYTSLQTNVVDAAEMPFDAGLTSKTSEVTKYVSKTGHIFLTQNIVINNKFWESLPEDVKAVFNEAANEVTDNIWESRIQREAEFENELKGLNMVIVDDVDREGMREATKSVWDEMGKKYNLTEIINKIVSAK